MLISAPRLTAQSSGEIEKPVKIEWQGKQGYFVTNNFMRDYITMSYELDKVNELLVIKDNLYKSLYQDTFNFSQTQKADKIMITALRISTEVLGVSLLGVIAGFAVYALVTR